MITRFERISALTLAVLLASGASQAWAITDQSTTANGAAFSSACAGLGFASVGHAGDQITDGLANCQTVSGAVGGTVSTSVSGSGSSFGTPYNNSASGIAGVQFIKLQSQNTSAPGAEFPGAQVHGGWNDSITLTGGTVGTQAIWVAPLLVHGFLTSAGSGGWAQFWLEAYQGHADLTGCCDAIHGAAYGDFTTNNTTHNGDIGSTWDYEAVGWGAVDGDSLNVNTVVDFYVPFTWGTAFDLGIYAIASSSETGFGGGVGQPQNTADASFENTVAWDGPGVVLEGGTAIANFTIGAGSGANYSQPFGEQAPGAVPEPATLGGLAFGIAAIGALRRRRV